MLGQNLRVWALESLIIYAHYFDYYFDSLWSMILLFLWPIICSVTMKWNHISWLSLLSNTPRHSVHFPALLVKPGHHIKYSNDILNDIALIIMNEEYRSFGGFRIAAVHTNIMHKWGSYHCFKNTPRHASRPSSVGQSQVFQPPQAREMATNES